MTMIEEDGRQLEVHSYLLVFLKFVQVGGAVAGTRYLGSTYSLLFFSLQAVIPTIEYDYTQQLAITSA